MKTNQISLALADEKPPKRDFCQLEKIIVDRGSKYTVTAGKVTNNHELKSFLKKIKSKKKYQKATHHSYAARVLKSGQIFDLKQDDGETGAGMVILRQLQKKNAVNLAICVTRWYGGVKLHGDRFKHVQNATKMVLEVVL